MRAMKTDPRYLLVKLHKSMPLRPMQAYSGVRGKTSDGKLLNKTIVNQQAKQMDDDALAIMEKTQVLVPGEDGLADIRVVEAALRSHGSGNGRIVL